MGAEIRWKPWIPASEPEKLAGGYPMYKFKPTTLVLLVVVFLLLMSQPTSIEAKEEPTEYSEPTGQILRRSSQQDDPPEVPAPLSAEIFEDGTQVANLDNPEPPAFNSALPNAATNAAGFLAYVSRDGSLNLFDFSENKSVSLSLEGLQQVHTPTWSHQGARLAFSALSPEGTRCLYTLDVNASQEPRQLICGFASLLYPSWSPDDSKLVFYGHKPNQVDRSWVVNTDGSSLDELLPDLTQTYYPIWLDNQHVALAADKGSRVWTIHVVDVDSPTQAQALPGDFSCPPGCSCNPADTPLMAYPAVSNDGSRIGFVAVRDAGSCDFVATLYQQPSDGSTSPSPIVDVTGSDGRYGWTRWSPDDQRIGLISTEPDGIGRVRLIDVSTSTMQTSEQKLPVPNRLEWSPDGTMLTVGFGTTGSNSKIYTLEPVSDTFTLIADGKTPAWTDASVNIEFKYSISGRITDPNGKPLPGVQVSTNIGLTATTDTDGNYILVDLPRGEYVVTPSRSDYNFTPGSQTIAVPPDATGVDFEGTPQPAINKPPLVLVHGIQLFSNGYRCDQGIGRYQDGVIDSTLDVPGASSDLADWLAQDYDVWIAHYSSSPFHTPSLETNAECLQRQIEEVYDTTGKKVVIVAHSMGGVVSRACLSFPSCRDKVARLHTLGSPHAGVNAGILFKVLLTMAEKYLQAHGLPIPIKDGLCAWQPGACELSTERMLWFNLSHPNQKEIDYTFIGGDATPRWPGWLLWPTEGANDGLVGKFSAVGWIYTPLPNLSFDSSWWDNNAQSLERYWTDETHTIDWGNAYYEPLSNGELSQAYTCIAYREKLSDYPSQPTVCESPNIDSASEVQDLPVLSQTTVNLDGHLAAGATVTRTVNVDTDASSLFFLSWISNTVGFSLVNPNGQIIDPGYAAGHPEEVTYTVIPGSRAFPPLATYTITDTQPGTWILTLSGADLGPNGTDYLAFVAMESSRVLSFTTDASLYHVGDLAVFTATLKSPSGGISGGTITANLRRTDNITDTVTFTDVGNGVYTTNYTIPDAPGSTVVTLVARGNDGGIPFTRQLDTLLTVASPVARLSGHYTDHPEDKDGDGSYETLAFEVDVTATEKTTVTLSANLSKNAVLIAHVSTNVTLLPGTQTLTLQFDGDDIRSSGVNGPYTISELILTDLDRGAVPAVLGSNVATTASYDYRQFGTMNNRLFLPIVSSP